MVAHWTTKRRRNHHTLTIRHTSTYASSSTPIGPADSGLLKITPGVASTRLLARLHHLRVAITLTFTPTGGTASQQTLTVTLTAPRAKHRRR